MAEWLNISSEYDSKDDSNNFENPVFEFEHAPYLTEFDDTYDPNDDPDFEYQEGPDDSEYDTEDETDGECELDENLICFKDGPYPSLGPCKHMCCRVWHLEPVHVTNWYNTTLMGPFLKHHGKRCTDKKCKNPNATGILFNAILLAKASKIFCPTHDIEIQAKSECVQNKNLKTTV